MALSDVAKKKALDFIEGVMQQANPGVRTETGSPIRSLFLIPGALVNASLVQRIEDLGRMFLGNYENITQEDMDLLAGDLLESRPQGSRSSTNLKIYLSEPQAFSLSAFPYFSTEDGVEFRPVESTSFRVQDVREEDGEFYVQVPVISTVYGVDSQVGAGEVTGFQNMPISVNRVSNPKAARGGRTRPSNDEFFQFLRSTRSNNTIDQVNGVVDFIQEQFTEAEFVEVVPSEDERMMRGEVWVDNDLPNLEQKGEPYADHTDIGDLDFDQKDGRAIASSGVFDKTMEGKRVAIENDDEQYRLIRKVVSPKEIVVSGHNLTGTRACTIWDTAPRIRHAADTYTYFPVLEIYSTFVDKSYVLEADGVTLQGQPRMYVKIPEDTGFIELPDSGRAVISEGTSSQITVDVTDIGNNNVGMYFDLDGTLEREVSDGESVKLYDMSEIEIAPQGDIKRLPAIYVLRVEQLNPITLKPEGKIKRTEPGNFGEAGWYMSTPNALNIFSAKENKTLVLDDKKGQDSTRPIDDLGTVSELDVWDTGYLSPTDNGTKDEFDVAGKNFDNLGGREIEFEFVNTLLNGSSDDLSEEDATAENGGATLDVPAMNARYFTDQGYREKDVTITVYEYDTTDPTPTYTELAEYTGDAPNDSERAVVYGSKIDKWTGVFPSLSSGDHGYAVDVAFGSEPELHLERTDMDQTFESVILYGSSSSVEPLTVDEVDLVGVADSTGIVTNVNVTVPDSRGEFTASPVRVTYATHSGIQEIQDTFDSGGERSLCENTLSRAVLPSLVDVAISYRGDTDAQSIQSRFFDLLSTAVRETGDEEKIRLDVGNVIAAIDEEGLADEIDVRPEIRVTNYLEDGEFEVRYLNPDEATKQAMAVDGAVSSGENRIDVKRLESTAPLPGRGKVFLGGNDPDKQEVIPFEAVIENDSNWTLIFRSSKTTDHSHQDWETAWVTTRDYDPEMEFKDGAIEIPKTNRPYIRQMIVTQKG